jgi:hypothetical protein
MGFAADMENDTSFAEARIKAAFYPKFEKKKCDQVVRCWHQFASCSITL